MKSRITSPGDIPHTTLTVIFIGILIASSLWIMRPFLLSLLWAALIVIATWPTKEKLQARLGGRRGLAVTIMTLAILLVVLVPMTLAVLTIIDQKDEIAAKVRTQAAAILSAPPTWIGRIPIAGETIAGRLAEFSALGPEEQKAKLGPYTKASLQWFAHRAGGIGMTLLNFLLTTIIAAILYANGETAAAGIRRFARRLGGEQGDSVTVLAGKAVRGVALGVVLTAIIQATIGGTGLLVAGVPAAGLLTAVMFMLCLAQLGPILVLVPAVIWTYGKAGAVWGTVLLVFAVVASTIDNFIRPVLIKKGADLPLVMIFAGVIGGLVAFGIVGLFVGPVVLAVTYTLLKTWVVRGEEEDVQRGKEAL